jgi:hypothetical protein
MLNIGLLAFANPWILLALGGLPVLWWLLRLTPPQPKRIVFPPVRLLLGLRRTEETPARTPLWLMILRMVLAAIVILAIAHPVLEPEARLSGKGPLVLVVDDDWTAAARWQQRIDTLERLIGQADRAQRPVVLLPTTPPATGEPITASVTTAANARAVARALQPKSWPADHKMAEAALSALSLDGAWETVWLSNGIVLDPEDGNQNAERLAGALLARGSLRVVQDPVENRSLALLPPALEPGGMAVRVARAAAPSDTVPALPVWLRLISDSGAVISRNQVTFSAGERFARANLDVPLELRNRATRLEIEGGQSAGSVFLLDERWRRRPVGIVSGEGLEESQPLLAARYYLGRALSPYSEIRTGAIADLLERETAVLALADIGRVVGAELDRLATWIDKGGVLVRFAGPRLAKQDDSLIPVQLRRGGRALGGALSWSQPARLDQFDEKSPFAGLAIPADVTVVRQVLAEPSLDLADKTWARLVDGTPLVTAEKRGDGWVVLFHTTADTTWSNLALSGLFVDMLRRLVDLSQGVTATTETGLLAPLSVLDGNGRLLAARSGAKAIPANELNVRAIGPQHPPGYYGREDQRQARNTTMHLEEIAPLTALPVGTETATYAGGQERDLRPWLLLAALLLAFADTVAGLALRGRLRPAAATLGGVLALLVLAQPGSEARAQGQTEDSFALAASLDTRLAYILTGDDEVDALSRAGIAGLSEALTRRTAVEPAPPLGVNIERDDILFFPVVYWPITPTMPSLSDTAIEKVDHYMKNGGTVVFDTRDQQASGLSFGSGGNGPGMQRLRIVLQRLDVPPLIPVPQDHVLTKAFYLMQEFPGRWSGGTVWVERHAGGSNDGVSPIIIGSADWAAAWAIDDQGRPMAAMVPGGELQREYAYRFGINLVMYALTGNYKADQVHVPALLERLGQ